MSATTDQRDAEESRDRTAAYWNDQHSRPIESAHDNFLNHPLIQAYISMRAFGSLIGQLDAVVVELTNRTAPGDRILSVGCGAAPKERLLAQRLPDRQFIAIDIADEIVASTARAAAADGLTNLEVRVDDFNDLRLEPGEFAAVLGLGAIHHIERLEAFWVACHRGLRPGGSVLAQEYVGPNRMQWTDRQLEHGTRALAEFVPERLRPHHRRVDRPSLDMMIRIDPSEAVRSADILPTCRESGLTITGYVGVGCALLQPVLMNQIAAFDPRNWADNLVLAQLFREEERLMQAGILGDDFAMFIATRP